MRTAAGDASATSSGETWAAGLLGWPLSLTLGVLALVQLGTWLPHYLTWPYWADHDVFAHAARAWDLGEKPYRDVRLNNFPGTIYVFYLLGKAFGWGRPWVFYGFDAMLLMGFVGLTIGWSSRIFGRALPGLVGSTAFLSYDLSLDYAHAAQRDWQGPAFAIAGLLVLQGWPGRSGRLVSALLAAVGFSIRPQVVLFLPAMLLVVLSDDEPRQSARQAFRRAMFWLAMFAGLAALAFLPLVLDGIFDDYLRALRRVVFGSPYNRATPTSILKGWLLEAAPYRWLVVPAAILLLSSGKGPRGTARPWLIALAGASFYKPLSPVPHSYLDIVLVLIWSANLGFLAGLIVGRIEIPATFQLASVLALLGMGTTTLRPDLCVLGPTLRAMATLRSGVESEQAPPGYRKGSVPTSAYVPWEDYRNVLNYLRSHTDPKTKVANAIKGDPAIVSMVDRRSAFPAESITWLRMVDPGDERAFAESLERAEDSVVVWSPGDPGIDPSFRTDRIDATVRRLYQFEARFGAIEVWRRSTPLRPWKESEKPKAARLD